MSGLKPEYTYPFTDPKVYDKYVNKLKEKIKYDENEHNVVKLIGLLSALSSFMFFNNRKSIQARYDDLKFGTQKVGNVNYSVSIIPETEIRNVKGDKVNNEFLKVKTKIYNEIKHDNFSLYSKEDYSDVIKSFIFDLLIKYPLKEEIYKENEINNIVSEFIFPLIEMHEEKIIKNNIEEFKIPIGNGLFKIHVTYKKI